MSDDSKDGDFSEIVHTPEEQAAFDERVDIIRGMMSLTNDEFTAEMEEEKEDISRQGSSRTTSEEYDEIQDRRKHRLRRLIWLGGLLMGLIIALIVILALWGQQDRDYTADLIGRESAAVEDIAPPVPAATPAEVLPPEVFTYTCADCGDTKVTQVPLDLNPDARYQFAYESDGTRIAILSVVDAQGYDAMAQALDAEYAKATEAGERVAAPKVLDDVADGAMVYGTTAIFKNGNNMGLLSSMAKQDAAGDESVTITTEELERLARIAAPRMVGSTP
ncbi:MAG: hypothetical protein LLG08_00070 [Actinomycetia bacterium]|nr:hypothetical protein [Actinomycetes bacterium]